MYILILETSTTRSLLAIVTQEKVVFSKALPMGYQSSRYLVSTLEEGFSTLEITAKDLVAVAVTTGPGSFTGIRVGAALAKGICLGQNLPFISLCSLKGLVSHEEGPFISLIDARGGGAYVLRGECINGDISHQGLPKLIPLDRLETLLLDVPVITPDASKIKQKLIPSIEWLERGADPAYLAHLAEQKFQKKEYSEVAHCSLIYSA